MEKRFTALEVDRALRATHNLAFIEWLEFGLEQQRADLELYFSSLPVDRATVLRSWQRLKSHHYWVPDDAEPMQRELYLTDLEALLDIMRSQILF